MVAPAAMRPSGQIAARTMPGGKTSYASSRSRSRAKTAAGVSPRAIFADAS